MAQSPVLDTKRLIITPFEERHLSAQYVGWLNDKKLMQYSEQRHRQHTIDSCRKYLNSFQDSPHYFWAIEARDRIPGHIGNMNAYLDICNRHADIGILVGERDARGKGFASEAFERAVEFLLGQCNIRKVTAGAMSVNEPMIKIMKRIGMVEDGIRRRHCLWNRQEVDIIHMAIFNQIT